MKTITRTVIVGAGEAGRMLLREFIARKKATEILGFLDDDPAKIGLIVEGKSVLGPSSKIADAIKKLDLNQVIVAMPSVHSRVIQEIVRMSLTADARINILILPAAEKYFDAAPLFPALEKPSFADLFTRPEFHLDVDLIREHFSGKKIMVTGAGGSIGSELCRQLLKFDISGLAAIGRGEHSIYKLCQSLEEYSELMVNKPEISYHILDVRDQVLLEKTFIDTRPEIVIHAAAHKHVPLMEYNEAEAICNNVFGTKIVLDLAAVYSRQFVLISSDKAVRPVSIMGASKRIAELLTCRVGLENRIKTAVVRFGNVIGSRGSVIPLFQRQIERGGPVTVTDSRMKRFFMSISEAALLTVNAVAGGGGEVFVLNMGHEYPIVEIARKMISWYGLRPDKDIAVTFTGLRPGEKLREDLCYKAVELLQTTNEKIFILRSDGKYREKPLLDFLALSPETIKRMEALEIRRLVKKVLPEFKQKKSSH